MNEPERMSYPLTRRRMLQLSAAAGVLSLSSPRGLFARDAKPFQLAGGDAAFVDELIRAGCLFFWEQAGEKSGQVLDRARNDLKGARDPRRMASIAATGFGLTALCIADKYGYLPHEQIVERVRTTLDWHLNKFQHVHGFYYHFTDIDSGEPVKGVEVSSIDTSLLLCGVLTARAYFDDAKIKALATQIYERVEWPWMLDGGKTFSMGWHPEDGFLSARWEHYCELMMIYLLGIGSPTHPVAPETWNAWTRPVIHYKGLSYISGNDPIFTHQYSQAWYDFRGKHDRYANYFENSITATKAHKEFCLSMPKWYSEDYWGISASDYKGGYTAWGGPPKQGPIDGSVVPNAAAGSLPFLPADCLRDLRALRANYGTKTWGRYGFLDAFNVHENWYDGDVLGIDQGISVIMAENLRSGFVWETFMKNPESVKAFELAGFHKD